MDTKVCENCEIELPLKSFDSWKNKNGTIGYRKKCFNCRNEIKLGRKPNSINKPFYDETQCGWFKLCKSCQQIKAVVEFRVQKGKITYCKSCSKEFSKEQGKKRTREGKNKEYARRAYQNNPEIRKKQLLYHRTLGNARRNQKRLSMNPQQREAYIQKCHGYNSIRRARKKGASVIVSFSKADIIKRDGLNCYLCEKLLTEKTATIDHVLPLARGGCHKPENAKIACKKCNFSKHSKTLTEYKKYRGDYL